MHFAIAALWFSIYDLKHHLIRRKHILIAILSLAPFVGVAAIGPALINTLLYLAIFVVSRGALGFGDVTLAFLMGSYLGAFAPSLADLLLANWISWGVATVPAAFTFLSKASRDQRLAFAPFMFLGCGAVMLLK